MEDADTGCECQTSLLSIVSTADGQVAAWCIWCGVGYGAYPLLLLKAGQPMTDVEHMEICIPTYPLLGKVAA